MGRHESTSGVDVAGVSLDSGAAKQPEPVLSAATISTLVHLVVLVGGWLGYSLSETTLNRWAVVSVSLGLAVFTLVTHTIAALKARGAVTPLANPRSSAGAPLVPLSVGDLLMRLPAIERSLGVIRHLIDAPAPAPARTQLGVGVQSGGGGGSSGVQFSIGGPLDPTPAPDFSAGPLDPTSVDPPTSFDQSSSGSAHAGRVVTPPAGA